MSLMQTRRLVDEIRAYVNSVDQTGDPRMAAMAQEYAQACREANERLQRCADYLEKGHRPEAIAIAEAEPDLLELAPLLNFTELDEWQAIVGNYGWERFQPVKIQLAASISDAYTIERQLAGLLRQHRRLAIAQAPLRQRLAVMREIAQIDTTTPLWQEDIVEFEKHRGRELREMGRAAAATRDPAQIGEFLAEYEAETWSSPVPHDLQQTHAALFVAYQTSCGLTELANRISAAMARLDWTTLGQLRERWNSVVGRIVAACPGWQTPQPLETVVGPALAYLDQADQNARRAAFERDVTLLQQAMRQDAAPEQVRMLLARVQSHGLPLPAMLQAELSEYHFGVAQGKTLKVMLIVVLGVALVAGLVLGYFVVKEILR